MPGFVYVVIRSLESFDGPEIDVYAERDHAEQAAAILATSGRTDWYGPQEQAIMGGSEAVAFLADLEEER